MSSTKKKAAKNQAKRAMNREFNTVKDAVLHVMDHPFTVPPPSKEIRKMLDLAATRPAFKSKIPVGTNRVLGLSMSRERTLEAREAAKKAKAAAAAKAEAAVATK